MNHLFPLDLHMHTKVSDGTDSPTELLSRLRESGSLAVFSLTDHDAVKGCREILDALTPQDPLFIPGVEFSCKDELGRYHILGYAYDPEGEPILRVVDLGHGYRMKKLKTRLDFLHTEFGICLPEEAREELFRMDNPGKPHIGNMMVRYGYAESKEQAIRDFLNRLRCRSEYVRPEEAISGILGAGGIPVLAHPAYGDGDQLILGDELDQRVRRLMDLGLQGLEGFYSGFTKKIRKQVLALADRYGLYVTAGSDYHGKNKLVTLGDTGLTDPEQAPPGLRRFLQAALAK